MSGVTKDRNKYLYSCETLFIRCLTIFLMKNRYFRAESVIVGYILQGNFSEKQILLSVCMSDIAIKICSDIFDKSKVILKPYGFSVILFA